MKLSDLQLLIDAIRGARHPDNQDPDVSFWVREYDMDPRRRPGEGFNFTDFDLTGDKVWPDAINEHRIAGHPTNSRQGHGDFTIPLTRVPFLKG